MTNNPANNLSDIYRNVILVTQSFGRESEYKRVCLTILSFYAYCEEKHIKTVLFTDAPEWFHPYFDGLPIDYVLLTPDKIKTMRGEIDFLHRMKIALIEEAFGMYPNANMLYVDSDTFFIKEPSALFRQVSEGLCFMHLHEFQFEEVRGAGGDTGAKFDAYLKLMESKPFLTSKGSELFTASHSSWNAGVMGLPNFIKNDLLDVYAITEQSFPETQNHASEQFAFSFVLQSRYDLSSCDDYVYHYWYATKKRIVDFFTQKYLNDSFVQLSTRDKLAQVHKWTLMLPKYFDTHIFTLKDNAVLAFDEYKLAKGYRWASKAMLKGGIFDRKFIKDLAYLNKRYFKRLILKK